MRDFIHNNGKGVFYVTINNYAQAFDTKKSVKDDFINGVTDEQAKCKDLGEYLREWFVNTQTRVNNVPETGPRSKEAKSASEAILNGLRYAPGSRSANLNWIQDPGLCKYVCGGTVIYQGYGRGMLLQKNPDGTSVFGSDTEVRRHIVNCLGEFFPLFESYIQGKTRIKERLVHRIYMHDRFTEKQRIPQEMQKGADHFFMQDDTKERLHALGIFAPSQDKSKLHRTQVTPKRLSGVASFVNRSIIKEL